MRKYDNGDLTQGLINILLILNTYINDIDIDMDIIVPPIFNDTLDDSSKLKSVRKQEKKKAVYFESES
ncbi:hypothetical protein [endosymbiont 'TC1' of Trimyema compressum]|uniref:hypothetical protein n=1 Tax=endosymbiont 'TC1' of Trimyema compressum TaxID=243899 RepID=UPI00139234C9|nr:hypothetical protein [endosymbiont 'TC1' of Trimyema compressum]